MKKVAVFILTAKCNLNCKFCLSGKEKDLKTDWIKKRISSLPKGVQKIAFTGGEPLLRADIFDLLAYARSLGYRTHLSTNGLLLGGLNKKQLGLIDVIQLPLDGSEKINDALRGKGHFKTVSKLLKKLRNKKIVVTTVATKINLFSIPKIEKFLDDLDNIASWKISWFKPIGMGAVHKKELGISQDDFDKLKKSIKSKKAVFVDDVENSSGYHKFMN
jgi:MoaA/NifB/PqqE/SkfB family radical SAM enzyme